MHDDIIDINICLYTDQENFVCGCLCTVAHAMVHVFVYVCTVHSCACVHGACVFAVISLLISLN